MVKAGEARKLGPRIYPTNMKDAAEAIVSRNLWPIAALLMPGSVVGHRMAFENRRAPDGSVFLSGSYPRQIQLPGVVLPGRGPRGDRRRHAIYGQSVFGLSRTNLSRKFNAIEERDKVAKTVGRQEVERRLAEMLRVSGKDALDRVRDQARKIAPLLNLEEQYAVLNGIISALMLFRAAELTEPSACAWAAGEPLTTRAACPRSRPSLPDYAK
jgi:hypothetical protein